MYLPRHFEETRSEVLHGCRLTPNPDRIRTFRLQPCLTRDRSINCIIGLLVIRLHEP